MRKPVTTAYSASRLNRTTFRIIHHDTFSEYPFIYVKIYQEPPLVVVFDTGCGTNYPADPNATVTELKEFIETVPVHDNGGKPLNAADGVEKSIPRRKDYIIICTHCHYDHIGGIEPFDKLDRTRIVASGNSKKFLSPQNIRHNSLCDTVNIPTPKYIITDFVSDGQWLEHNGRPLRLKALHTPGHTPDSLTVYDESENTLFTGDSFYFLQGELPGGTMYQQPVIFPPQGNWLDFTRSLQKLIEFELMLPPADKDHRSESDKRRDRISVACAHTTEAASEGILFSFRLFFVRCLEGSIPVAWKGHWNGEEYQVWSEKRDPEFAMLAPTRLREQLLTNTQASRIRELLLGSVS